MHIDLWFQGQKQIGSHACDADICTMCVSQTDEARIAVIAYQIKINLKDLNWIMCTERIYKKG